MTVSIKLTDSDQFFSVVIKTIFGLRSLYRRIAPIMYTFKRRLLEILLILNDDELILCDVYSMRNLMAF